MEYHISKPNKFTMTYKFYLWSMGLEDAEEQKDRYEIFLKVCETGSFSKAAEALNYTQSGISQMIAGLEEELGVRLFARSQPGRAH